MSVELESPLRLDATLRQVITNISLLADAHRLLDYNNKRKVQKERRTTKTNTIYAYKKIRFNHPLDRRFNQS